LERATLESAPKGQRADSYIVLASQKWICSFRLGDTLPDIDSKSLADARHCVLDGLEFIQSAMALDATHHLAWFYKAQLLREMAKLGEKEKRGTSYKARYDRLAREAESRSQELKTKTPESDGGHEKTLTGDKELDGVINAVSFKLVYLVVPVPIPIQPEPPR
jgi:hypothetical protein